MAPNIVASIEEVLSWQNSESLRGCLNYVNQRYKRNRWGSVQDILVAIADSNPQVATTLIETLQGMGPDRLNRFILAPETMYASDQYRTGKKQEAMNFVKYAILAERSENTSEVYWTACGDTCTGREFSIQTAIRGSVVDFDSPYAKRPLQVSSFREVKLGFAGEYDEKDKKLILRKIEEGLSVLEETSPLAYDFVRSNNQVIIPRKDNTNPGFFTSSSSRAFINRLMLVNAHLEHVNRARVVNALIHESVHSYLYKIERFRRFHHFQNGGVNIILRSPWSGSCLNINTFLHACFVYTALHNYWYLERVGRYFSSHEVIENRINTLKGFEQCAVAQALAPYLSQIDTDLSTSLISIGIRKSA